MNKIRTHHVAIVISTVLLLGILEAVIFGMRSLEMYLGGLRGYLSISGMLFALLLLVTIKTVRAKRDLLWLGVVTFFTLNSAGLLFFVDSFFIQQIITLFAIGIFLVSAYGYQQFDRGERIGSRSVLFVLHFATLFYFFTFSYAVHVNYTIPQWLLMAGFFLVVTVVSAHSFLMTNPTQPARSLVYSGSVGIIAMQLAWLIHYWPFGYLTTGAVMLVIYYILWDLFQSVIEGTIRKQRIVADIILFLLLSFIVLVSSPWTVIDG